MRSRSSVHLRWCAVVLAVVASSCGGKAPPPGPGTSLGVPPDLRGSRIMVFPLQDRAYLSGDADAELAFALNDRSDEVKWIFPDQLERALAGAPSLNAQTERLPVGVFLQAEVRRIGDPLFGILLRLGAVVDGEAALIPIRAVGPVPGVAQGTSTLAAALIHVRTGRVLWFGIVEGTSYPPDHPAALPSLMEELARTLLWYAGE
ncbi:MAG: hypothetical protein OEZ65_10885 [Gemmatimonadota bacterium]|nr:hypothetical protein [Gemmatimonadota bacterium]MDH5760083.1 hypothetical protein [Gemmatimonadota bacterium]